MPVALVASAGCERGREPAHAGRSLGAWRGALIAVAPSERQRACDALGAMGAAARDAVPELILALDDAEAAVALAAATALVQVGADAVARLEQALAVDVAPLRRVHAAFALAQLVPHHELAASVLVESFAAPAGTDLAERALRLTVALGPLVAGRIAALVEDPYVTLRVRALAALGAMGERARPQLGLVTTQVSSPDAAVREAALAAAARIRGGG